jgi:hypothetical protein
LSRRRQPGLDPAIRCGELTADRSVRHGESYSGLAEGQVG